LLTFVRGAHYWTRVHPELAFEDDVKEMLASHAALADALLNDPEASASETTGVVQDELDSLRRELALREEMERARIEGARAEAKAADLTDVDRRKTEFLAMLAHELRNPLAPIRNALQIMRLTGLGNETFRAASVMMGRQVDHMVRLIDDLLDVNRIDRGQVALQRRRSSYLPPSTKPWSPSSRSARSMRHELTVKLPRDPVYLHADPVRLAQIIANLLNNACKFTEPGGRLELECETQAGIVDITIRDNGVGIAR
jgi:signal transduction histidine kinase